MTSAQSKKLMNLLKSDEFVSRMMLLKTYEDGIQLLKEFGIDVELDELIVPADIALAKMYEYGFTPE